MYDCGVGDEDNWHGEADAVAADSGTVGDGGGAGDDDYDDLNGDSSCQLYR